MPSDDPLSVTLGQLHYEIFRKALPGPPCRPWEDVPPIIQMEWNGRAEHYVSSGRIPLQWFEKKALA